MNDIFTMDNPINFIADILAYGITALFVLVVIIYIGIAISEAVDNMNNRERQEEHRKWLENPQNAAIDRMVRQIEREYSFHNPNDLSPREKEEIAKAKSKRVATLSEKSNRGNSSKSGSLFDIPPRPNDDYIDASGA